jgi:2-amino-4-hydroxy-6-hydroxymethyldihydropteridine diphosphokinase
MSGNESAAHAQPIEITIFIGLGSNLGQRRDILDSAIELLRSEFGLRVEKISDFYTTAPVGGPPDQPEYLNGVAQIATTLDPQQLLERLLDIEQRLGRIRTGHWGPRCIDLDLLLFGQEVIDSENLKVPHPLMHQREFVLRGLAQIAPDLTHPLLGLTALQMFRIVSPEPDR